jgi:hypothetical protein
MLFSTNVPDISGISDINASKINDNQENSNLLENSIMIDNSKLMNSIDKKSNDKINDSNALKLKNIDGAKSKALMKTSNSKVAESVLAKPELNKSLSVNKLEKSGVSKKKTSMISQVLRAPQEDYPSDNKKASKFREMIDSEAEVEIY